MHAGPGSDIPAEAPSARPRAGRAEHAQPRAGLRARGRECEWLQGRCRRERVGREGRGRAGCRGAIARCATSAGVGNGEAVLLGVPQRVLRASLRARVPLRPKPLFQAGGPSLAPGQARAAASRKAVPQRAPFRYCLASARRACGRSSAARSSALLMPSAAAVASAHPHSRALSGKVASACRPLARACSNQAARGG